MNNNIIHELNAPYTLKQNGITERKNRPLTEAINVMLISLGLSKRMWGEDILSA